MSFAEMPMQFNSPTVLLCYCLGASEFLEVKSDCGNRIVELWVL